MIPIKFQFILNHLHHLFFANKTHVNQKKVNVYTRKIRFFYCITLVVLSYFYTVGKAVSQSSYYNASVYISPNTIIADFIPDVLVGSSSSMNINGDMNIYAERFLIHSASVISGNGKLHIDNPSNYSLPWNSHILDANGAVVGCTLVINTSDIYMTQQTHPGFSSDTSFDLLVSGEVEFTQGIIHTGSAEVGFLPGASHSGAGNTSFVDGIVSKTGNTAFSFPVGENLLYAPIGITAPSQVTDRFSTSYHHQDPHAIGTPLDTGLHHISYCEYWMLERESGSSSVGVTLSWDQRSCGVVDPSELRVCRWNGNLWENKGNLSFSGTAVSGSILSSSVSSFSPFTLGTITEHNPLPVSMASFTATCEEGLVLLEWKTLSEQNNNQFETQYSTDMQSWNSLSTTPGAGNSNQPLEYSERHRPQRQGIMYYRLLQTDFDGTSKIYGPVSAMCETTEKPLLYPNPVWDIFTVSIPESNENTWKYDVYDSRGVHCMSGNIPKGGNHTLSTTTLSAGAYRIIIHNTTDVYTLPFIKILQ